MFIRVLLPAPFRSGPESHPGAAPDTVVGDHPWEDLVDALQRKIRPCSSAWLPGRRLLGHSTRPCGAMASGRSEAQGARNERSGRKPAPLEANRDEGYSPARQRLIRAPASSRAVWASAMPSNTWSCLFGVGAHLLLTCDSETYLCSRHDDLDLLLDDGVLGKISSAEPTPRRAWHVARAAPRRSAQSAKELHEQPGGLLFGLGRLEHHQATTIQRRAGPAGFDCGGSVWPYSTKPLSSTACW